MFRPGFRIVCARLGNQAVEVEKLKQLSKISHHESEKAIHVKM
jgi:hypothetical protein